MSRRSSARTARSPGWGSSGSDTPLGRGSPRCWSGRASRRGGRGSRDRLVRARAAPERRRPGRGGAWKPLGSCWPTTPTEAAAHADALELANGDAARPDEVGGGRGSSARRRRAGRARDARPRPVGGRDRRARRGPSRRGQGPAGRRRRRPGRRRSGPRVEATGSWTSARRSRQCGDLFIALRRARRCGRLRDSRPTAGTAFRTRFLVLAAASAPTDPRVALPIDLALPARDVDYALFRDLASLAPAGPGNPDPLVAVLGLTVTRVRAATGGHTQLTLRRERDVLDGIAFGRADLAETVHEGDRVDVVARLASRIVRRVRVAPARDPRRVPRAATTTACRSSPTGSRRIQSPLAEVPA